MAVEAALVGELCGAVGAAAGDCKASLVVAGARVGTTTYVRRWRLVYGSIRRRKSEEGVRE